LIPKDPVNIKLVHQERNFF